MNVKKYITEPKLIKPAPVLDNPLSILKNIPDKNMVKNIIKFIISCDLFKRSDDVLIKPTLYIININGIIDHCKLLNILSSSIKKFLRSISRLNGLPTPLHIIIKFLIVKYMTNDVIKTCKNEEPIDIR